MYSTPNYELLKDAYAIFGGIPDKVINLNTVQLVLGSTATDCGTICCGMGWLAHYPQFQALGLKPSTRSYGNLRWKNRTVSYSEAAQRLFGLNSSQAFTLFGSDMSDHKDHKNILLNRIMRFLAAAGQVTNPIYQPV